MHRAVLRYDQQLVNRAVRSYWRRSLGLGVLVGAPVLCVLVVVRMLNGDRSWYVGFLAAAALIGVVVPILVYWVHHRNSMAKLRDMKDPIATFVAEDDSFTLASDHGSSTLKWDSIKEVWGFEGFWLFLFSRAHFATIPLDGISKEMRSFVLDRIQRRGGKVPSNNRIERSHDA